MRIPKISLIIPGLLAATLVAVLLLVYIPQGDTLEDLRGQITRQTRELKQQAQVASAVPELFERVQAMKERYRNFDRRLPKRQELAGFLQEITGHLADERLSEQVIQPGTPTKEDRFHAMPIILKFRGSYLSLAALLERIDKMERLTCVQRMSLSLDKAQGGVLDIELQLNIYFTES